MKLIEKIETEWSVDCKIDLTALDISTRAATEHHSKYFKYLNDASADKRLLKAERDRMILLKTDYYLGNIDHETLKERGWRPNKRLILKTDLPMHLAADEDMIEINLELAEIEDTIDFLKDIIKNLNSRQFNIKNLIENRKFMNGGY